jgi:ubiquinone/menaquinone biosynthesis C-methylase UbiE
MIKLWRDMKDIQENLDKDTEAYRYIKRYGILLDKKGFNEAEIFSRQYQFPTSETSRKLEDWHLKPHKDPFIYDKLVYINNPIFFCSQLSFLDRIEKGARVLDLGCGFGYNASYLLFRGVDVCGVDFSLSSLQVLKRKADKMEKNIDLVNGDIENIPMPDNPIFDYIIASQIFRRDFVDEDKVLKGASQLLREGGSFHIIDYLDMDSTVSDTFLQDHGHRGVTLDISDMTLREAEEIFDKHIKKTKGLEVLEGLGYETDIENGRRLSAMTGDKFEFLKGFMIKGRKPKA